MKITEAILKDMILEQLLLESPKNLKLAFVELDRNQYYSDAENYFKKIYDNYFNNKPFLSPKKNPFVEQYLQEFVDDEEYVGPSGTPGALDSHERSENSEIYVKTVLLAAALLYSDIMQALQEVGSRRGGSFAVKFIAIVLEASLKAGAGAAGKDKDTLLNFEIALHRDFLNYRSGWAEDVIDKYMSHYLGYVKNKIDLNKMYTVYSKFYNDFFKTFVPLQRMYFNHIKSHGLSDRILVIPSREEDQKLKSAGTLHGNRLSEYTYLDLFYAMYNYVVMKKDRNILDQNELKLFLNLMAVITRFNIILRAYSRTNFKGTKFTKFKDRRITKNIDEQIIKATEDFNDIFDKSTAASKEPYDKILSKDIVGVIKKLLTKLDVIDKLMKKATQDDKIGS